MTVETRTAPRVRRRGLPAVLRRRADHPAQGLLFERPQPERTERNRSTWTTALESLLAAGALAAFLALGMLAS